VKKEKPKMTGKHYYDNDVSALQEVVQDAAGLLTVAGIATGMVNNSIQTKVYRIVCPQKKNAS
jgi:hypothetical protein